MKTLAFYLPQFHPIPENDAWWGTGFTEWTNVSRSRSLFPGHFQPHLPADLGFYDLRLSEARQAQACMAEKYGITGFCYYHYWFEGKQLLERPFHDVLAASTPDLPICLCWANESWSRRWLGEEKDVLIAQTYSDQDDLAHSRYLCSAFSDPRYIRHNGRPLFLVYRPHDHPKPERFIDTLTNTCANMGVDKPYLVGVDAHWCGFDYREMGYDATLRFQPQLGCLEEAFKDGRSFAKAFRNMRQRIFSASKKVYPSREARSAMLSQIYDHEYIPTVLVSWDNSPRRGKQAIILNGTTAEEFKLALNDAYDIALASGGADPMIFINAWNEWAEGNHLEPDAIMGCQYLEAVDAVTRERGFR
jgi:lipopolysaccharide biosynthesis protein